MEMPSTSQMDQTNKTNQMDYRAQRQARLRELRRTSTLFSTQTDSPAQRIEDPHSRNRSLSLELRLLNLRLPEVPDTEPGEGGQFASEITEEPTTVSQLPSRAQSRQHSVAIDSNQNRSPDPGQPEMLLRRKVQGRVQSRMDTESGSVSKDALVQKQEPQEADQISSDTDERTDSDKQSSNKKNWLGRKILSLANSWYKFRIGKYMRQQENLRAKKSAIDEEIARKAKKMINDLYGYDDKLDMMEESLSLIEEEQEAWEIKNKHKKGKKEWEEGLKIFTEKRQKIIEYAREVENARDKSIGDQVKKDYEKYRMDEFFERMRKLIREKFWKDLLAATTWFLNQAGRDIGKDLQDAITNILKAFIEGKL